MRDIATSTTTGELRLDSITPDGGGRFSVQFRLDNGPPLTASVPPAAIESFKQFRRAVAQQLGCWPTWADEDLRPQDQRKAWAELIEQAFREGGQP